LFGKIGDRTATLGGKNKIKKNIGLGLVCVANEPEGLNDRSGAEGVKS